MRNESAGRKQKWANANKERRAEKAREDRRLAKIAKGPVVKNVAPAVAALATKSTLLQDVLAAEEARKAERAEIQRRGDEMQVERWRVRLAEIAVERAEDARMQREEPQAWAMAQLKVMLEQPHVRVRANKLRDAAFAMGVPAEDLTANDPYVIETKLRQMAMLPTSDGTVVMASYEETLRWCFDMMLDLYKQGSVLEPGLFAPLLAAYRAEKGL